MSPTSSEPSSPPAARLQAHRGAATPDTLIERLTRLNLRVLSLSVLLCFALIVGSTWVAARERQSRAAEVSASLLASSLAAMIVFDDKTMAHSELEAFSLRRELIEVQVLDLQGRHFGGWVAPKRTARAPIAPPGPLDKLVLLSDVQGEELLVWAPVLFRNERVGAVFVRESFRDLDAAALQLVAYSSMLIAVAILLAARALRAVQRRALAPLVELSALAERVAQERNFSLRATVHRRDEVGRLSERFNELLKRAEVWQADLHQQLQQEQKVGQQFQQLAHHDSLTGLPNRLLFQSELQRCVGQALAHGQRMALMFIDLDNFKTVNDRLGHDAGDAVLREVSARMSRVLRGPDVLCRLGGDEFALIVTDVADMSGVEQLALRLIAAVREPLYLNHELMPVGATVGLAFCPDDARDASDLLTRADQAMYLAKRDGKNTYRRASDVPIR